MAQLPLPFGARMVDDDDDEHVLHRPPAIGIGMYQSFAAAHEGGVSFLSSSPDCLYFASCGSEDSTVKVWERIRSGAWEQVQLLDISEEGIPECGGFDPGSCQCQFACGCQDGRVILWRCEQEDWTSGLLGQWREEAILMGHDSAVTGVTFYSRNVLLLSGSEDGAIRIWKLADACCIHSCVEVLRHSWGSTVH